jgi:hypothetical protein
MRSAACGNPFGQTHPLRDKFCFLWISNDSLTIFFKEDRGAFKFGSGGKNALVGDRMTVFLIECLFITSYPDIP